MQKSEAQLDETVANLLEGTGPVTMFADHDLSLITRDERLLNIYVQSGCRSLAEFLRLGWKGRSEIGAYGWAGEVELKSALRRHLQHAGDSEAAVHKVSPPAEDAELSEQIRRICDQMRLNERDIKVLRSRLWCRSGERLTLAEIADRLRLSRERVRQIDENNLEQLRAPEVRDRLKAILRDRTPAIRKLPRPEGEDPNSAARRLESELSANDLFLIRAVHGSIENWLAQSGSKPQSSPSAPDAGRRGSSGSIRHRDSNAAASGSASKATQRMDLRDFTPADLKRLEQLLERKEQLAAEMAEVEAALADFRPSRADQEVSRSPSVQPSRQRRPRGELKERILAELKSAGREGLSVSELAEKLETDPKRVHSWYYSVGRKLPQITKAGRGRIAWQEPETAGTS